MANVKGRVSRHIIEEKQRIGRIAKYILIAFCLQFVFYIFLVNAIPIGEDLNGDGALNVQSGEINSFFYEIWDDRMDDGIKNYHIGSIQFIHNYNMVLLVATVLLCLYYGIIFLEENEGVVWMRIKMFFSENIGLLLLVCFLGWTFIGSFFAYDTFRSFIGCNNLRDGFLSFMFYGSILVLMLLLSNIGFGSEEDRKKFEKTKKIIVYLFLAVATLVAGLTICNYNAILNNESFAITLDKRGTSLVTATASLFNNSNHYGYFLSIATIVAAAMFVKESDLKFKIGAGLSYIIMTYMLVLNDTFGAYLGVGISLVFMTIYTVIRWIVGENKLSDSNREAVKTNTTLEFIFSILTLGVFIICSALITNYNGENIAKKNFAYIEESIQAIIGTIDDSEVADASGEVSGELTDTIISTQTSDKQSTTDVVASEAGSGRWKLWVGALKIIAANPIMGVGSENMLFAYAKLGINEGRSHNLILQLAGTTGIPGMLFYVVGIAFIFFRALRQCKEWDIYTFTGFFVMISYLISSLTGNSAFYTSGYFYIFVGLVVLGTKSKKNDKKVQKIK